MAQNGWQRRISRAEELAVQHPLVAEILRFYVVIARFQESLGAAKNASLGGFAPAAEAFSRPLPRSAVDRFQEFLAVVGQSAPQPLCDAARELHRGDGNKDLELLTGFWTSATNGDLPLGPSDFFARAFLQPYGEQLRAQSTLHWNGPAPSVCPFCRRKPGLGVLRPLGDGGQRSLVCSFCLGEWEFRRIVCPACGEENHSDLPVYTAEEFKHVRVEACERCRCYIKTVDLTKNGRAQPVVDEIASLPLDLWAQKQGYTKLQVNLMQL